MDKDGRGLSSAQKAFVNELRAAGYKTLRSCCRSGTRSGAAEIPPVPKRAKVAAFVHYQKMKGDARSAIGAGSPHCVFKSSQFFSLEGSGTGARRSSI